MRHEILKHKLTKLHFKPEGYMSTGDPEFLEELFDTLKANGFEPSSLVYSGFDGTKISKGEPMPRYLYIFGMNEAGWRNAIKYHETNPAQYAEGWETPCIALYKKEQLARVYSSRLRLEDIDDRIELSDIQLGERLTELPSETPIVETVVHKDFPDASPTDALVGLVYIE